MSSFLAEAGFSECVNAGVCDAGFDAFFVKMGIGLLLVLLCSVLLPMCLLLPGPL
ncbi:hypothetical protein [Rhodococcus sp. 14-2483-1-2]|uniref:hypothetical protein n=1 Tax=Rhodococcus sp. 14-2483-1-2 TaxID=2023147 RepID=UPI0014839834|nr:hypothetical protein [Rhodococcus sp. 14-2483-1-2]